MSSGRQSPASSSHRAHTPTVPSQLRQSHPANSPPQTRDSANGMAPGDDASSSSRGRRAQQPQSQGENNDEDREESPTAYTALLGKKNWDAGGTGNGNGNDDEDWSNRPYSPRPASYRSYGSFGWAKPDSLANGGRGIRRRLASLVGIGDTGSQTSSKRSEQFQWFMMYAKYYVPCLTWMPRYRWEYFRGDLAAALTMASFYIPMSLSYASNLGHIPPINGLYSFVFQPFFYALLGTCPMMVVGPEAAGSLLTGSVVRENINRGKHHDHNEDRNAQISGTVTALAGAIIFIAGLARQGYLDNVLSRPFLRGFISAIGVVIFVDQLIPETGLSQLADHVGGAAHGSSLDKIMFMARNVKSMNGPTTAISLGAFVVIMTFRFAKVPMAKRYPWVVYLPDRLAVVIVSAIIAWQLDLQNKGVEILGEIRTHGPPFKVAWPFMPESLSDMADVYSTAFLIALLGFFESSVAAKSIRASASDEDYTGLEPSANRELVALGACNLAGGMFMSLPAFGGYGRSKVNASTGGRTPMSSLLLSFFTIICVLFLLPYFYYIPKGVLSAMISVVAYSLLEEMPGDLKFFIRIRGWLELFMMALIFLTTFFFDLKTGIAVGIGFSLLRILKHATRPRIQILGRVKGTNHWENAEMWYSTQHGAAVAAAVTHTAPSAHDGPNDLGGDEPTLNTRQAGYGTNTPGSSENETAGDGPSAGQDRSLEFFANTLTVKIPEPLTFANTGSLAARLSRLWGLMHNPDETLHPQQRKKGAQHPATVRNRRTHHANHALHGELANLVFDVHGVTSLDGAGAQVLHDIVVNYCKKDVNVYFCRLPGWSSNDGGGKGAVYSLFQTAGIVDAVGGESHFFDGIDEACRVAEAAHRGAGVVRDEDEQADIEEGIEELAERGERAGREVN